MKPISGFEAAKESLGSRSHLQVQRSHSQAQRNTSKYGASLAPALAPSIVGVHVDEGRRLKNRSIAAFGGWRGDLAPRSSFYVAETPEQKKIQEAANAAAVAAGPRVDVFASTSEKGRIWALQFIFDLKLRTFGTRSMLEQELRKPPGDRKFMRFLDPDSTLQLDDSNKPLYVRAWRFIEGTAPAERDVAEGLGDVAAFGDALLRGAGQAIFMNNPLSGLLLLVAMLVTKPWTMICGILGVFTSTIFAWFLGTNVSALGSGLFGYNGLLLGGALSVMVAGGDWNPLTVPLIIVGAAFTTIFQLAFGNITVAHFGSPPLAFPFVFVTQVILASVLNSAWFASGLHVAVPLTSNAFLPWGPVDAGQFFAGWIRGVGAITFAGTWYGGLIILAAMFFYSRILMCVALGGSLVGSVTALALGFPLDVIYAGGYSYCPSLVAMSIAGFFYVINFKSVVLAFLAAIFTTVVNGYLVSVLKPLGLPQLNLAFDIVTFFFVVIQFSLSGVTPVPLRVISAPEQHLKMTRLLKVVNKKLAKYKPSAAGPIKDVEYSIHAAQSPRRSRAPAPATKGPVSSPAANDKGSGKEDVEVQEQAPPKINVEGAQ